MLSISLEKYQKTNGQEILPDRLLGNLEKMMFRNILLKNF